MKTRLTVRYVIEGHPKLGPQDIDRSAAAASVRKWLETDGWLCLTSENCNWQCELNHGDHVGLTLWVQEMIDLLKLSAARHGCLVTVDVDCEGEGQLFVGPSGNLGVYSQLGVRDVVDTLLDQLDVTKPNVWELAARMFIQQSIDVVAEEFDDPVKAETYAQRMQVELDGKLPQIIELLRLRWLERLPRYAKPSSN